MGVTTRWLATAVLATVMLTSSCGHRPGFMGIGPGAAAGARRRFEAGSYATKVCDAATRARAAGDRMADETLTTSEASAELASAQSALADLEDGDADVTDAERRVGRLRVALEEKSTDGVLVRRRLGEMRGALDRINGACAPIDTTSTSSAQFDEMSTTSTTGTTQTPAPVYTEPQAGPDPIEPPETFPPAGPDAIEPETTAR